MPREQKFPNYVPLMVSDEQLVWLDTYATFRSAVLGFNLSRSDILRQSIDEYIERHQVEFPVKSTATVEVAGA